MKRIYASAVALLLLLTALSGCADQQDPAASANPEISGDERLILSMTIAETLPSGVVFEYRGEQAYCFYAYDDQGHLYRVLWTDFEGLREKDRIRVEYSGRKEFTYEEYPSGWTPKYEITASSVTPERGALASCLTYKDGGYTLTLPQSGKTLELTAEQVRFVPYITDELVAEAENQVAQAAAAFVNHSGFYLQVNQDYLCLMIEAIRYLDSPNELGEDHEHLFYDGRISSQAVPEEEKTEIGTAKSAVRYRSGEEEIFAFCSLLWSEQDNGDGTFTATQVDKYDIVDLINGKTHISMEELRIPTLLLDGDVTARVPVNGEILRVRLLSEGGGRVRRERKLV